MQWYKSSERKPPDLKDVLFVWLNGEIERMCIGWYSKDHDAWVETREGKWRKATHWMFLPLSPSAVVDVSTLQPVADFFGEVQESETWPEEMADRIQDDLDRLIKHAQEHFTRDIMGDGYPLKPGDDAQLSLDMVRDIYRKCSSRGPMMVEDWRLIGFARNGEMMMVKLDAPFVESLTERIKEYYESHA